MNVGEQTAPVGQCPCIIALQSNVDLILCKDKATARKQALAYMAEWYQDDLDWSYMPEFIKAFNDAVDDLEDENKFQIVWNIWEEHANGEFEFIKIIDKIHTAEDIALEKLAEDEEQNDTQAEEVSDGFVV